MVRAPAQENWSNLPVEDPFIKPHLPTFVCGADCVLRCRQPGGSAVHFTARSKVNLKLWNQIQRKSLSVSSGRKTGKQNNQNHHRFTLEKEGHMRQARYRFFLLPLFLVLACAVSFAQANSELTGIVTDQSGAVVAGSQDRAHRSGYWHQKTPRAVQPACTTSPD